jgi:CheY-like chemotaxis protein
MDVRAGKGEAASPVIRILLVDDHDDTLVVIRTVLEQRGFEVLPASCLAEARKQATNGFDLLVCDIDLPDGTGIELIERLKATQPVRAIAMSGYGTAEDIQRSVGAGFSRHLVKPFTADKLLEAIASAIDVP